MSGKYTGPYWSDGKLQESVEFGDSEPVDYVDEMSRLHDSAYAKYKGQDAMLAAADELYYESLQKDPSMKAQIARNAVLYGNYTTAKLSRLAEIEGSAAKFGLPGMLGGLLYFGVENLVDLNSRLSGDKYAKEKEILREYYKTDPKLRVVRPTPLMGTSMPPDTARAVQSISPPETYSEPIPWGWQPRRKKRRRRIKRW